MDTTGWGPEQAAFQLEREELVYDDLLALLSAGIPLETAKRLARYSPGTEINLRDLLQLRFARAATRTNSLLLQGSQLDAATLYAVFIPDIPELGIDTVEFLLNGVPHHVEASVPWDYDGTLFDGTASRVTFVPGNYTIEANITDASGTFLIDAAFTVE